MTNKITYMKLRIISFLSILSIIIVLKACNAVDKKSRLNEKASIMETNVLPENPLLEHPLTSSINMKEHTMSTLYGNTIAWEYAKLKNDGNYPQGAILYEVTWTQKSDSVWFGANIPKEIKSVERISYLSNQAPGYELYKGQPLRKSTLEKDTTRLKIIASQKIAVSPGR
jgi:hypothetical protein